MQRGGFVTGILTFRMDSHIHYGDDHKTYSGNGTKYNFKQNIKVKFQLDRVNVILSSLFVTNIATIEFDFFCFLNGAKRSRYFAMSGFFVRKKLFTSWRILQK
jgi:hypothetical protein